MIHEPLEGVVVEHLRPQVGVVAGLVAVGPDVQEVAGAVARRHVAESRGWSSQAPPPRRCRDSGVARWRAACATPCRARRRPESRSAVALVEGALPS